ncbi:MAG: nuclear transport factor 2 family protein [Actinobacteria bacterium]|nr:nuclear transport factor 2 family protein [Actinomycetota bacterium]
MDGDEQAIWSAVNDIYAAFLAGDRTRIDSHLHPDATIWDSSEPRLVRGRAELDALRGRRPPGEPPASIEASDPVIDVWGDTALVRHLLTVGGDMRVRNTSVWRRRGNEWLCVHNHEDVLA